MDGISCFWLLAPQSLTTLEIARHDELHLFDLLDVQEVVPFDLGRFPALRHLKIQLWIQLEASMTLLYFLKQLFSISSSMSGIETLGIAITWDGVDRGRGKDLFSSDAGWSTLDEILTSEKFIFLRKAVLALGLEMTGRNYYPSRREFERNLTSPYVNVLLPMFRALADTQRTL